jgi:RHS repeat-associated protein
VTDAKANETIYAYDDMGRPVSTSSPDTGASTYAYDQAGNLRYKTDAKGVKVEYTYDNLNRVTAAVYPDSIDDLSYTYDQGANGKGHLTTMSDPSGIIAFGYDARGRLVQKTSTINSINYPVTYAYTPGGKVSAVTYPSGRVMTYDRNSLGKISQVTASGIATPLASNLTYRPFGGPLGLTNGFGGTVNNVAGECDCLTVSNPGQPRERTYGYDANRNLTSITGTNTPWYSQSFGYDQLNRLTSATGRYGSIAYTYDDVGNRLTKNTNGTVETYTNFPGTNSLQQITGGTNPRTFAYDPNGNITSDGTLTFIYDQNNQLAEVEQGANNVATYWYNGLGQRVIKQVGANTTVYHYDLDGKLIAESLPDGTMTREYLYMGKVRVSMVDVAGGNALYNFLNDRLGTPEILTDASGTVAWEAWYEPFGEAHIHPSSSVVNNIRLPGQYYDSETGLHYNYHRYYDPGAGRYLTPDPIGLDGGKNLFTYGYNNPTNLTDPNGLDVYIIISRGVSTNLSTPGTISVRSTRLAGAFEGYTLEPSAEDISGRISAGTYHGYQRFQSQTGARYSPPRLQLENAESEQGIPWPGAQIHVGNYRSDTSGCILVGAERKVEKVEFSRASMEAINAIIDADGGRIVVIIQDYSSEGGGCE